MKPVEVSLLCCWRKPLSSDVCFSSKKKKKGVIDDGNQVGSETSLRVQQVYKVLKREKDCEFYKLLLHPTSFSESVENIFHFSFLVQNGYAGIRWDEDDDGKMIACITFILPSFLPVYSIPKTDSLASLIG